MSLRAGHGTGRGVPRIEVLPADELPQPDPTAPVMATDSPGAQVARRLATVPADQRAATWLSLTDAERSAAQAFWGTQGALKRWERTRLLQSLGLVTLQSDHLFYRYELAGQEFAEKHVLALGAMYDGIVGEGPASIVLTAAIQLASSRFIFDQAKQIGDAKGLGEASRLGNDSRQNIHAALELQSREAAARGQAGGRANDPFYDDEPARGGK